MTKKPENQPIEHKSELLEFFHEGGKFPENWRVGTEYESVGVYPENGRAVRYFGERGIEKVMSRLADILGWKPEKNEGRVIGLSGEKSKIHLEPGGQIELAGEKCVSIHCAKEELEAHIKNLATIGDELGISFLGIGMQPVSGLDDIEWIPKTRYRIMAPYMEKVGSLGHRMMKQTASLQINIDYGNEEDAMEKFRVATAIVPVLSAMFANSPISSGTLNGFMTLRGHVWTDTDKDRCGMLPFALNEETGFEDYMEYALDVPMYFILRQGELINMTERTFREFLQHGSGNWRATIKDWNLHLTTLFPEVRIKKHIEIRCFDNQPQRLILAVPALVKGIFHDLDSLRAVWNLVKDWSWEERLELYHASHMKALEAPIREYKLGEIAGELLAVAWQGLKNQNDLNRKGEDETIFLEGLKEEILEGYSPARRLARKWRKEWNCDIKQLIDYSSYKLPA